VAKKKASKKVSKLVKKKKIVVKERVIECMDCNRSVKVSRYKGRTKTYRCAKCRALKSKIGVNDKGQYVTAGQEKRKE